MEVWPATPGARPHGNHRMGNLGKGRAGCVAARSPSLGAAVELHYLAAPADVLFDRIQRRGLEKPLIDREAVTGWFEIFQAPTPEERALFDKPLVADPASGGN